MEIFKLEDITESKNELVALLVDCVESGASVGFIPPLADLTATDYWASVAGDCSSGSRKLILALDGNKVIGAVQLSLTDKANGLHRAEVEKLMVHTSVRGRGVGKALMLRAEKVAASLHRSLLILDTREGDVASSLYRQIGYIEAGQIPGFARSSSGELDATIFFYKQL